MSDRVLGFVSPVRLEYTYVAGRASSRFLAGIAEGEILGQRCPACRNVYVPPRGSCPTCGVPTDEEVRVADRGIITTFCVVNIPYAQAIQTPYVCASILLDGADIALFHLIQECEAGDVRMGMRVEAVWAPRDELAPTMESIRYFRPTGEPDAPYESYKEHL